MNKKISLFLYYTGTVLGSLLMNYIIKNNKAYADCLIEGFYNICQINTLNGQALFFYLLFNRIKQIFLLCIAFLYFSKQLVFIICNLYFSFIQGMILSLAVYYFHSLQIIIIMSMLIPYYCYYALFKIVNIKLSENKKWNSINNITNIFIKILISTIFITIVEVVVNSKFINEIFSHI